MLWPSWPSGILARKCSGGCLDCLATCWRLSGRGRDWGQLGPELKRDPRREKGEKEDWVAAGGEQNRGSVRMVSQETGVILVVF